MSHFNKSLNYTVLTYSTFSFISSVFVLKFSRCITEHKMSLKILRMKFSEYSIGDRIDILSRNPVNVIARLFSRSQLECNNVILFMTCKKMTSLYFSVLRLKEQCNVFFTFDGFTNHVFDRTQGHFFSSLFGADPNLTHVQFECQTCCFAVFI